MQGSLKVNVCFYQVERAASCLSKDQQAKSKEEAQGGAHDVSGEFRESRAPDAKHDVGGLLFILKKFWI